MPLSSAREADGTVPWSEELLALLSRNAPRQQCLALRNLESEAQRRVLAAAALEARVRVRLATRCTGAEQRPHLQPPVFVEHPAPVPTPLSPRPAANLRLLVNHQYGLSARARARSLARSRLERAQQQQQLVDGELFDTRQPGGDGQLVAGCAEECGEAETRALSPAPEAVWSESEPAERAVEDACSASGRVGEPCFAPDISAPSEEPATLMQPREAGLYAEQELWMGEGEKPDELTLETTSAPLLRQRSKPQSFLECDARRALMSRLRLQLR